SAAVLGNGARARDRRGKSVKRIRLIEVDSAGVVDAAGQSCDRARARLIRGGAADVQGTCAVDGECRTGQVERAAVAQVEYTGPASPAIARTAAVAPRARQAADVQLGADRNGGAARGREGSGAPGAAGAAARAASPAGPAAPTGAADEQRVVDVERGSIEVDGPGAANLSIEAAQVAAVASAAPAANSNIFITGQEAAAIGRTRDG